MSRMKMNSIEQNSNSNENIEVKSFVQTIVDYIRKPIVFYYQEIIFGPIVFKLILTFTLVIVGSIFKMLSLPPESYFSSKKNLFNIYFVKIGWLWTIGLLGPFIYLTLCKTNEMQQILSKHFVRLFAGTILWWTVTNSFVYIESRTSSCMHDSLHDVARHVCLEQGHQWKTGIELSGHTFLLLYSILIINEEIQVCRKTTRKSNKKLANLPKDKGDNQSNNEQTTVDIAQYIIKILYHLLACLTVIWEIMLLSTALYFHETSHKIFGGLFAIVCWYFTYRIWYRTESTSILFPLKPQN